MATAISPDSSRPAPHLDHSRRVTLRESFPQRLKNACTSPDNSSQRPCWLDPESGRHFSGPLPLRPGPCFLVHVLCAESCLFSKLTLLTSHRAVCIAVLLNPFDRTWSQLRLHFCHLHHSTSARTYGCLINIIPYNVTTLGKFAPLVSQTTHRYYAASSTSSSDTASSAAHLEFLISWATWPVLFRAA